MNLLASIYEVLHQRLGLPLRCPCHQAVQLGLYQDSHAAVIIWAILLFTCVMQTK